MFDRRLQSQDLMPPAFASTHVSPLLSPPVPSSGVPLPTFKSQVSDEGDVLPVVEGVLIEEDNNDNDDQQDRDRLIRQYHHAIVEQQQSHSINRNTITRRRDEESDTTSDQTLAQELDSVLNDHPAYYSPKDDSSYSSSSSGLLINHSRRNDTTEIRADDSFIEHHPNDNDCRPPTSKEDSLACQVSSTTPLLPYFLQNKSMSEGQEVVTNDNNRTQQVVTNDNTKRCSLKKAPPAVSTRMEEDLSPLLLEYYDEDQMLAMALQASEETQGPQPQQCNTKIRQTPFMERSLESTEDLKPAALPMVKHLQPIPTVVVSSKLEAFQLAEMKPAAFPDAKTLNREESSNHAAWSSPRNQRSEMNIAELDEDWMLAMALHASEQELDHGRDSESTLGTGYQPIEQTTADTAHDDVKPAAIDPPARQPATCSEPVHGVVEDPTDLNNHDDWMFAMELQPSTEKDEQRHNLSLNRSDMWLDRHNRMSIQENWKLTAATPDWSNQPASNLFQRVPLPPDAMSAAPIEDSKPSAIDRPRASKQPATAVKTEFKSPTFPSCFEPELIDLDAAHDQFVLWETTASTTTTISLPPETSWPFDDNDEMTPGHQQQQQHRSLEEEKDRRIAEALQAQESREFQQHIARDYEVARQLQALFETDGIIQLTGDQVEI